MMTNTLYADTIRHIVALVLEVDPDTIGDDTDFVLELGADSLSIIEIMARLETSLNLRIDQSQLARMTSVAAIYDVITDITQPLAA
jgi:acyl carrier protein